MTWKELEQYDYQRLLSEALSRVSSSLDKREGSVVYDMIAPAMYELAYVLNLFIQAGRGSLLQNASGDILDDFALRQGLNRRQATYADVSIHVDDISGADLIIPIGTRFTSIDQDEEVTYLVVESLGNGDYRATAEVAGTIGNSYTGTVTPLSTVANFGEATITGILSLAIDTESDYALRQRVVQVITQVPFGGNVSDYKLKVKEIDGVAGAQVYPTWNGGGTVKISIAGIGYDPVDNAKLIEVQEIIDPTQDGSGVGIAPIGHTVTVVTPTSVPININATITTASGITVGQVRPQIEENLANYVQELRESWDKPDSMNNYSLTVFLSRVISEIMDVSGVTNVGVVTINGSGSDATLTQNATTQQMPVIGTITLT